MYPPSAAFDLLLGAIVAVFLSLPNFLGASALPNLAQHRTDYPNLNQTVGNGKNFPIRLFEWSRLRGLIWYPPSSNW
jgi:hypothetical protein